MTADKSTVQKVAAGLAASRGAVRGRLGAMAVAPAGASAPSAKPNDTAKTVLVMLACAEPGFCKYQAVEHA